MEVPQYAIHVDGRTGVRKAGVIIQVEADEARHIVVVGFRTVPDNKELVATLPEFELLGTKRPDK